MVKENNSKPRKCFFKHNFAVFLLLKENDHFGEATTVTHQTVIKMKKMVVLEIKYPIITSSGKMCSILSGQKTQNILLSSLK